MTGLKLELFVNPDGSNVGLAGDGVHKLHNLTVVLEVACLDPRNPA